MFVVPDIHAGELNQGCPVVHVQSSWKMLSSNSTSKVTRTVRW